MRPAAVHKVLGAVLLVLALGALGSPALADDGCVQACIDTWVTEKEQCLQTLNTTLARLDQEAEACYDLTDPLAIASCIRSVNGRRMAAKQTYQKCLALANTRAWSCYRACQGPSPTR